MNKNNDNAGDLTEIMIEARRVSKVTKGGRRFGFRVIVLVGNSKGSAGFAVGKHAEVIEAKKKAIRKAKSRMVNINRYENRTIHHTVYEKFGASKIIIKPAPPGCGIIAGDSIKSVCEVLGIKDIVTKSIGSSNPRNIITATFRAFQKTYSPDYIAKKRGKLLS